MKLIQVAVRLETIRKINSGALLMQYLKGFGLNPEGDIRRVLDKDRELMIYTERIHERSDKVGEVSEMASGIRDNAGGICSEGYPEDDGSGVFQCGDSCGREDRSILYRLKRRAKECLARYSGMFDRTIGDAR